MKVGRVQTFLVNAAASKNNLYVKVETDDGLHGWGECYTSTDRDRVIEWHVQEMARYLVGRSPFNIKHFCNVMFQDFANQRGGMDFYSAISGVEQALWDIVGKAAGQPVYNLLGGASAVRHNAFCLTRFPNVSIKVPGLGEFCRRAQPVRPGFPFARPIPPLLAMAYQAFGPGRMMWGSDYPPVSAREGYGNALRLTMEQFADKSEDEREQIFGRTALNVFQLRI